MRRFIPRLLTFFAAFLAGLLVVIATDKIADNYLPTLPIESVPQIDSPAEINSDPPMMDYRPLHWPRIANTRLAIPGKHASNEELPTLGFEDWLGLYKTRSGWEVKKAKVKITKSGPDPDFRYMPLALYVTVRGKDKPLFVFKGVPAVKPGKAETALISRWKDSWGIYYHGAELCKGTEIELGNITYVLDAIDADRYSVDACYGGKAVLSDGNVKQILSDPDIGSGFEHNRLIWAGDADGDGRLDLILNYGSNAARYYNNYFVLYLSSYARSGELVAPVAAYDGTQL